jgi:4-oxalocrotonate tautomerase
MPIVTVEMLSGRTREQKRQMAEAITREVAQIARCSLNDVQIVFDEVARENWAVGGKLLSEPKESAA